MEFVTVFMTEDEGPFELNAEEIDAGRWATPTEIQTALHNRTGKILTHVPDDLGAARALSKNTRRAFPH